MQYVTNKERKKLHGMRCADQLFAEDREIMLQADSDAEKLHASRTFYEPAPVDFRSLLNDGESMIMQIKYKIPSVKSSVVRNILHSLAQLQIHAYRSAYAHFSGCIKDNNGSMTEDYRDTVFTSDLETVSLSLS